MDWFCRGLICISALMVTAPIAFCQELFVPSCDDLDFTRSMRLAASVPIEFELTSGAAQSSVVPHQSATDSSGLLKQAAHSYNNLGCVYFRGFAVPRDYAEAIKWFRRGAERGSLEAANNLAFFYYYGVSGKVDYDQAADWFRAAAYGGLASAQAGLAEQLYFGNSVPFDDVQAYVWARLSIVGGASRAVHIASDLERSLSTPQTAAAEKIIAEWNPGSANWHDPFKGELEIGIAAQKRADYDEAFSIFQTLAQQGDPRAQLKLGILFYRGYGVDVDIAKFEYWMRRAAAEGNLRAQLNLAIGALHGYVRYVSSDQIRDWLSPSVDRGVPQAEHYLGVLYDLGWDKDPQHGLAAKWYARAAALGYVPAVLNLGKLYFFGRGVAKNVEKAESLYKRAAMRGNTEAQLMLGLYYFGVEDLARNDAKAEPWLARAANSDEPDAQYLLSLLYMSSDQGFQDLVRSYMWARVAEWNGQQDAGEALLALGGATRFLATREGRGSSGTQNAGAKVSIESVLPPKSRFPPRHPCANKTPVCRPRRCLGFDSAKMHFRSWLLAFAALLMVQISAVLAQEAAPATPQTCTVGAYVADLYNISMPDKSFDADLWFWSLCADPTLTPLHALEFINANSAEASLDSTLPRGGLAWSSRKVVANWRNDYDVTSYPFDKQTLKMTVEEATLDNRQFVYTPDTAHSTIDPAVQPPGWRVVGFRVEQGERLYPTSFGDPTLAAADGAEFSRLVISVDLQRDGLLSFLKLTAAVYVAAALALISFRLDPATVFGDRMGILAGTLFAVVISMTTVSGQLGSNERLTLIDLIHVSCLILIVAAALLGVRQNFLSQRGVDAATLHRIDGRYLLGPSVAFVLVNVVLVGGAVLRQ